MFIKTFMNQASQVHDSYSEAGTLYRDFRPAYPEKLFRYLAGSCRRKEKAWDVATGNGQAAQGLAKYFKLVHATDPSPSQLKHAISKENIEYRTAAENHPELKKRSIDLICVAQGVHYLNLEKFYQEVNRVLKKYGVLACWNYGLPSVEKGVDECINEFCNNILHSSWDAKRRKLEMNFRSLEFPLKESVTPRFEIRTEWSLEHYLGFLKSMSAVRKYRQQAKQDPLLALEEKLKSLWGNKEEKRNVVFPLFTKMGILT